MIYPMAIPVIHWRLVYTKRQPVVGRLLEVEVVPLARWGEIVLKSVAAILQ